MKRQNYVAPEMEIISVELEKGIAISFGEPGGAGSGGGNPVTDNPLEL